jgi:tetratricopeptide (TPR) repeat protein
MRKLLDAKPKSPETRLFCAAILVDVASARKAAGDVQQALALYTEALSVQPQYHLALFHIGVLAYEQGRSAEAQALYECAVSSDPTNVQVSLSRVLLPASGQWMHDSRRLEHRCHSLWTC